jgi:hypothetical protein
VSVKRLRLLLVCLPFSIIPWQTHHSSTMTVERYSNCSGLTASECCEQMLNLAAFKASREQLPNRAVQVVHLGCSEKQQLATLAACRSIAFSRKFSASEVKSICDEKKSRRVCKKNDVCNECTVELAKLSYTNTFWACSAVTQKKGGNSNPCVVLFPEQEKTSSDADEYVMTHQEQVH